MDGGDGCAIMSMHLMDYIFKSDLNGSFCYIYIYIYIFMIKNVQGMGLRLV